MTTTPRPSTRLPRRIYRRSGPFFHWKAHHKIPRWYRWSRYTARAGARCWMHLQGHAILLSRLEWTHPMWHRTGARNLVVRP